MCQNYCTSGKINFRFKTTSEDVFTCGKKAVCLQCSLSPRQFDKGSLAENRKRRGSNGGGAQTSVQTRKSNKKRCHKIYYFWYLALNLPLAAARQWKKSIVLVSYEIFNISGSVCNFFCSCF